jgi:hypothetical protein
MLPALLSSLRLAALWISPKAKALAVAASPNAWCAADRQGWSVKNKGESKRMSYEAFTLGMTFMDLLSIR